MGEQISYENGDIVDNSVENTVDPLDVSMAGVEIDPESQQAYLEAIKEFGLDIAPGTGEYRSGEAGIEAFKKGDYLGAGLGALGAVPGFGMITRGARRLFPTILDLGDEVVGAMNKLQDRRDELLDMLPAPKQDELGRFSDPVKDFAETNPAEAAELANVKLRIAEMNKESMMDGRTVESTLRAGGFTKDSKFAQGGVVSLVDTARNMTRGPRGIMSFAPYLGAK